MKDRIFVLKLVGARGFEPPTPSSRRPLRPEEIQIHRSICGLLIFLKNCISMVALNQQSLLTLARHSPVLMNPKRVGKKGTRWALFEEDHDNSGLNVFMLNFHNQLKARANVIVSGNDQQT